MSEVGHTERDQSRKDFFISYNHNDEAWAEWIAYVLEKEKFTVTIQAWDFLPGSNFVVEMQKAASQCDRTIAVLSPDYLASMFTQAEWAVAFSVDPSGSKRKLIPVRVRMCEPPGLLRTIVYCDLLGLAEEVASAAVLRAVKGGRSQRTKAIFPAEAVPAIPLRPPHEASADSTGYPGVAAEMPDSAGSPIVKAAVDLLGLIRTTRTTFEAQARLRDSLVHSVAERLVLHPRGINYEDFLAKYADKLVPKEARTFQLIREFTKSILLDYNHKALAIINDNPKLEKHIPGVSELRSHLTLWLSKYHAIFDNNPSIALIYVGVDEGVPYPEKVERETWNYLKQTGTVNELLGSEQPPDPEFTERHSDSSNWSLSQLWRWEANELAIIKSQLASLDEKDVPEEIDIRFAELLSEALPPFVTIEKHAPAAEIIEAVHQILLVAGPQVGQHAFGLIEKANIALKNFGLFWQFKALLPLLPRLAMFNLSLDSPTNLNDLWSQAKRTLMDWADGHVRAR